MGDSESRDPGSVASSLDERTWSAQYAAVLNGRLERVQAAAQQWLGTITALLGLFSAAVLVGGTSSVSDLTATQRAGVFIAAIIVYTAAFAAVVYGALATFGGLGVRRAQLNDLEAYITEQRRRARLAAAYLATVPAQLADSNAGRKLTAAAVQQAAQHHSLIALAEARLAQVRQMPTPTRRQRAAHHWQVFWGTSPADGDAFDLEFRYDLQTNWRRARLHDSRILGISAAVLSGALAMTLLGHQTLTSTPTPTVSVLIVHDGIITCHTATGSVTAAGITGVTQILVVPRC